MLLLLACVLALVASGAMAVSEKSLRVYDERMDVRGGTGGEAMTHTEVDILEVFVSDEVSVDSYDFQMTLAGNHSPDAVYKIHLLIDNQHDAWLEFRDGDNWTGSDSRGVDWEPSGGVWHPKKVVWKAPIPTVNATMGVRVVEATATIVTEGSKTFTDTCSWDLSDLNKGLMNINVYYNLKDGKTIVREVDLGYYRQSAAGVRYQADANGDQFITQEEIDDYLQELETWVNGTDMSMQFEQHTSKRHRWNVHFEPGPLTSDGQISIDSTLTLTYPETGASEIYYAWELELEGHFLIPYYRADDLSSFDISAPYIREDKIYRFGQWDLTPVTEQFYLDNYTIYHMNGSQLRTHWNTTARDWMGFSVFAEDKPAEPDEDPCNITNEIILVPAAFIAFTGWRGWERRRRVGPEGRLSPPSAP
jgi:hypothetical protein